MRHVRVTAASVLAGVLLLGGCSGGDGGNSSVGASGDSAPGSPAGTTPGTPDMDFKDCTSTIRPQIQSQPGGDRDLEFGCGTLPVPATYDRPTKDTLKLTVVRVRIGDQKNRVGSLVINPGGPGGSGLDAAVGLSLQLPTDVLSRFDLVGFDPRGVGLSAPVECVSDSDKDQISAADPDPRTPEEFAQQVAFSTQITQSCSKKYGAKLADFNTVETARDMDLLRAALGDEKLTYLGYSYGSLLGTVYAQLFPTRVRALVLDGAVDSSQSAVDAGARQAAGFENAFNQFAAACKSMGSKCPVGPDARKFVVALMDKARKAPVPSSKVGETRKATAGNVQLAVISSLYDQTQWDDLSRALDEANRGDAQGVFALGDRYNERRSDGHYTNILDANLAINCNDTDEQVSPETIQATLTEWRTKYPLFGAGEALGLLNCQSWQSDRHPIPTVGAKDTPPILVVGTVNDPATPYDSAKALTHNLGSAVLLTWNGQGHTAYPKTPCVTSAVNDYLVSLTVPKTDAQCPAK